MTKNFIKYIKYICSSYPKKDDLSKARLNKILYLADWKSAVDSGKTISDVNWIYNHYGPYVKEIKDALSQNSDFDIKATHNYYGQNKEIITLKNNSQIEDIEENNKKIIDEIINKTSDMRFNEFIDLVYSTYPVLTQPQGSHLKLKNLAKTYTALIENKKNSSEITT